MSLAYFPLYPDRYEADTAHLSILEDGAYNRLLRLCWRSPACKLPNDLAWIYRQCRAVSDADQAAICAVLDEFFTKARGKIWNKKLVEIHEQVLVAHSNKSEAGKKGAAAKALKNNTLKPSTAKASLKQPEPEPEPELDLDQEEEKEEAVASSKKLPAKGSRLPADWVLCEEWIEDVMALGLSIDLIRREGDKFRDYWIAKPGKDGVKVDWRATWRNWVRRRADDNKTSSMTPSRPRAQAWGEVVR